MLSIIPFSLQTSGAQPMGRRLDAGLRVGKYTAIRKNKEETTNSLVPNALVDADGAFRDGNVPSTVGRRRFDSGHL